MYCLGLMLLIRISFAILVVFMIYIYMLTMLSHYVTIRVVSKGEAYRCYRRVWTRQTLLDRCSQYDGTGEGVATSHEGARSLYIHLSLATFHTYTYLHHLGGS